ncbi:MAG: tetrahydromethanopterin S-methyltransferase subunit H [Methanosarcinaceae archaeon]|jgi:tetrahydromethanopterin S-methyltransferase subunit H|nr:tetrahydromethanopterin S-methyltransferase subunit H [Methanosarcinaceae archaeon]NKQ38680.1 tetrahydromethanopterin S-methyltransferase subunit H [Methanosarcinales archaeon]
MFKFDKKQEVFEVGGAKIGGQPGEYPTVLIGSIFYGKHKIVSDEDEGIFDLDAANTLWGTMKEMSAITGNPIINQIVGETPQAITRYIDWFVEIEDECAFLIDSSAADVRAAAAEHVTEIGVADRAIHNSINASISDEEVIAVTDSDIDAAIVLAFNATDPSVKGKLEVLETGGGTIDKGLFEIAKDCGITKPLVDVAAMPLGQGAGATMRSVMTIKSQFGYPVGGGYHNMASAWDWMKVFKKQHENPKEIFMPTDIGTNLVSQTLGSDFQLFGPIESANLVFPATAMVDIILAESAKEIGLEVKIDSHPINKLL